MSAQSLQHLIMHAALDETFCTRLAQSPAAALAPFDLAAVERDFLHRQQPTSMQELAAAVEAWRRGDLSHGWRATTPAAPAAVVPEHRAATRCRLAALAVPRPAGSQRPQVG